MEVLVAVYAFVDICGVLDLVSSKQPPQQKAEVAFNKQP